jgi:hypothetical protein
MHGIIVRTCTRRAKLTHRFVWSPVWHCLGKSATRSHARSLCRHQSSHPLSHAHGDAGERRETRCVSAGGCDRRARVHETCEVDTTRHRSPKLTLTLICVATRLALLFRAHVVASATCLSRCVSAGGRGCCARVHETCVLLSTPIPLTSTTCL